jgi:hypothetical protein
VALATTSSRRIKEQAMSRPFALFLTCVALTLAAWQPPIEAADPPSKDPLDGKTFRSVKMMEVGLGPNGVVLGHWSVTFRAGKFSWRHSDVVENGTYEVDAKTGAITGKAFRRTMKGTLDAKTGKLTWENAEYEEMKSEKTKSPGDAKKDLATFKEFLVATKQDARWQTDPLPLTSAEIAKAYPNRRVYFTFARPPLPPGAPLPELLERYKKQLEEYQKRSLRITVTIDEDNQVAAMREAKDFNAGLMPVKTDEDAMTAAAAILAMAHLTSGGNVSPGPVNAKEVTVTRTASGGWTCVVKKQRAFDGTVSFDAAGKVIGVTKMMNYIEPLPPSVPPKE